MTDAARRLLPALAALAVAGGVLTPAQVPRPLDQPDATISETRYAGLQWTFVRIKYTAGRNPNLGRFASLYDEPWAIDHDAAEQNLSRRLRSVTAIAVGEPLVLTLDDPRLWLYPWLYIVEPGNLRLQDHEVPILRDFLLRGGSLTFDDFHGPIEWANLEAEMKRVFPERPIVDLPMDHPIFNCFYKIEKYPQVPGLGSFLSGRTWEKGGFTARLRAILDEQGRAMVLINWNTDMGDGIEWSNAQEYPGYVKHTAEAYRMMINEIVYSLTH
jgi:hypothetical protein